MNRQLEQADVAPRSKCVLRCCRLQQHQLHTAYSSVAAVTEPLRRARGEDYRLLGFGVQTELHAAVGFNRQPQVRVEKGAQLPVENAGEDGGTG